jgi:hypothetical protein
MTGHIGTGILVLLLDIISLATLSSGIGWIGVIIGIIIWIVDLVIIGTGKWLCKDGTVLSFSGQTDVNITTNVKCVSCIQTREKE